jgi:dihydropteroate synthase
MGILNVTPDSFSDGGRWVDSNAAVEAATRMAADGADLIDVGGESTRPGAPAVPADEEWRRIEPVLAALGRAGGVPISVDTYKAEVARRAIDAGAEIVNDVSGLQYDPGLGRVAAETGVGVVLMHNRGRSADMYAEASYHDVVADVTRELHDAVARATAAGIEPRRIVLDPGLGFAKRADQTIELLARLEELQAMGFPILSGPSRKSFLTRLIGEMPPAERVWGTAAAVTASVLAGAHIVRVHDVREMAQIVRVADAIAGWTSAGR